MIAINKLEWMWKEAVVVYFEVLLKYVKKIMQNHRTVGVSAENKPGTS